jgi:hypothetical protein
MALSRALLMPVALIRYGAMTIANRWRGRGSASQPLAKPLPLDRAELARGLAQLADYHGKRRYVFDGETGDIIVVASGGVRGAATGDGARAGAQGVRPAPAQVPQSRPRHEAACAGRPSRSTRAEPRRAAGARVPDERRALERQAHGH